uniref:RING-type domain-containing protein n=1 Tax=Ditylenchus dipsaci TaxID=166011 RepID=A0A915CV26_9BILA
MKSCIAEFFDGRRSASLLKEIRSNIETESKCQICWELSIGPIICNLCGNNVGCSSCVDKLFTTLSPTAKCPLCNADWQRAPQDLANTSLWIGHCPNRALAGILNQMNQNLDIEEPICSSIPTIKPLPVPCQAIPKSLPLKHFIWELGPFPDIIPMILPSCEPENDITRKRLDARDFNVVLHTYPLGEAHNFVLHLYILLLPLLFGYAWLTINQKKVLEAQNNCAMDPNISRLQNNHESSTLLSEIKKKIEIEPKCQICWELSIRPIICNLCGNNVGCSSCVNKLFTTLSPTARCPLCNADWQRAPQDLTNSSF